MARRFTCLALGLAGLAVLCAGACGDRGKTASTRSMGSHPAEVAALGRRVFFDPSLSASGRLACASCHSPDHAYGPPNDLAVQPGGPALERPGLRAVPSLRYVLARTPRWSKQYQADPVERAIELDSVPIGGFARDGRYDSLREQARGPFFDPAEMANADAADLARKIRRAPYADEFRRLFGAAALAEDANAVAHALQALERFELDDASFHRYSSKFDRVMNGQEQLTAQEARGLRWFLDPSKGNCAACHTAEPGANGSAPLFTDFSFAALGIPRHRALRANADPLFYDLGLCGPVRGDQTARREFCGMFKTPSLRNAAVRGAFMHNGVFGDLTTTVRFYAERDTDAAQWYPVLSDNSVNRYDDLPAALRDNVMTISAPLDRKPGDTPALTDAQVQDIVAFLCALTDADSVAKKTNCNAAD